MTTYKAYAERCGITYEAVRQLTVTYADKLEGHIHKDGRAKVIDDEGVLILDGLRGGNPVVLASTETEEELQALREENRALLLKVAALQDELLQERGRVLELWQAELKRLEEPKPRGFWARLFGRGNGQ